MPTVQRALFASLLAHGALLALLAHYETPQVHETVQTPLQVQLLPPTPKRTIEPVHMRHAEQTAPTAGTHPPIAAANVAKRATPSTRPPPSLAKPRDWNTAASAVIRKLGDEEGHSFFNAPALHTPGLQPLPARSATFNTLTETFRPLPGPLRLCGKIAELDLGDRKISMPTLAACDAVVFEDEKQ